jgi:single-strand DNA-binding protein
MASFNQVTLLGNLTRDVELRYAPSNTAIASTGLAMNRKWKDQQGNAKEEVCFVDITAFGSTADVMSKYTAKGDLLMVSGRLKFDQWEDKNGGGKRSKLSVVVESLQLMPKRDGGGDDDAPARPAARPAARRPAPQQQAAPESFPEDDIPF